MKKILLIIGLLTIFTGCSALSETVHDETKENEPKDREPLNIEDKKGPLDGKVIILDPGHGGEDPGAMANGLVEKDLNLTVSEYVRDYLLDLGATVLMTRTTDTNLSLDDRAIFSAEYGADIFVSIHHNTNEESYVQGTEVYFNKTPFEGDQNPYPIESEMLATFIFNHLTKYGDLQPLAIKDDGFAVLRKNIAPSALVEVAFVTNAKDATLLKNEENLMDYGKRIVKGIEQYFQWIKSPSYQN